jgi:hypothetical protein
MPLDSGRGRAASPVVLQFWLPSPLLGEALHVLDVLLGGHQ